MIPSDNIDDLRLAEQQLRERERQLESLMGHLPGLAYRALADEHWTALFASKGIEDLPATRPTSSFPAGSTTPTSCCPRTGRRPARPSSPLCGSEGCTRPSTASGTRTARSGGSGRAATECSPRTAPSASSRA